MRQPTLKWAVFRQREEYREVHVIPAYTADGLILEHHIVDVLCPCKPVPEPRRLVNANIIIVHNEPGVK